MTVSERLKFELSDRLRLKLALKTCIACLIAGLVSHALGFENSYWVVFTTFLTTQLTTKMTVKRGFVRIAATVFGCAVGFMAVRTFSGDPYIIAVTGFFWICIMFYIGMSGIYPLGALLAALTPFIIVYMGGDIRPDQALTHAFYRMTDILTGVCISWAVIYFVLPVDDEKVLISNLGALIKKNLHISFNILKMNPGFDMEKEIFEFRRLVKRVNNFVTNSGQGGSSGIDREQYGLAVALCRALLSHTLHLNRIMSMRPAEEPRHDFDDSAMFTELTDIIEEIMNLPDGDIVDYLSGQSSRLGHLLFLLNREIIEPHKWLAFGNSRREFVFSRVRLIFYIVKILQELSKISGNRIKIEVPGSAPGEPSLKEGLDRLKKFDRETAYGALKGALSVLLSLVLWVIPFKSMQAMVPAFIVSYTGYRGQSLRRFVFLALGTLIGGASGLLFFFLSGHINIFATGLISLILFVFSYIGLGEEDYSAIGVNGGIMFIICIGPLAGAPGHYDLIYRSVAGMIFGGLIAAFVMKFVFPFNFRRLIEDSITNLASIYIKSFNVINGIVTGKTGSFDEMDRTWKDLRKSSAGYIDLLRDLKWDMLFLDKRFNDPVLDEDAVYYIYRNFVSLFFILKFIGGEGLDRNIEKSVGEAMNILDMLHDDWKRISSQGAASDIGIIEEKSSALWMECETVLEKEALSQDSPMDRKNLLYQEIFLYDLSSLIRQITDVLKLIMENPDFAGILRRNPFKEGV